jgi:Ca2+-binding RTX toxin-like protein
MKHCLFCTALAVALSGCGGGPNGDGPGASDGDYPGIGQTRFALLANACVVSGTGVTAQVDAGETAVISLNTTDGNIAVNANQTGGAPCEVAPNLSVTITPGTAGDHGVLLDFSNGLFAKATAAATPKIKLTLGPGTNDTMSVRGTPTVDHFYLGSGVTPGTYVLNINGGATGGDDAFVDASLTGAEHFIISSGAGNDVIDGSGLFGTTGPFPAALTLFGGPDDDTLTGGAGNDTMSGDAGNDHLNGAAGSNTYACGAANDGTDVVTVAANAMDTVDYSQRFNAVSALLNGTAVSGEPSENDTLPDTVAVLLGGSGNDSLSAAGSSAAHVLEGGPGNDTLTGGNGNDTLVGGNGVAQVDGDDVFIGSKATADYSARTQAITVTINAAGAGGANANDGDPTTTRHVQTATGAAAGATITASSRTVTGLSNMNAGSVGRQLIIAGSASGNDDGSYRIASVPNATTVVLNATDTGANATWTNDATAAWTFAEDAGPEKDEVRSRNVVGSATFANTITGDTNDNFITGGAVADTLVGGAGSDTLNGLAGDDVIYGGVGDDTLIGGPGNDSLFGGDGSDVLEGDANTDAFVCDGNDDSVTPGTAPGSSDYTVDIVSGAPDHDTRTTPNDCEF